MNAEELVALMNRTKTNLNDLSLIGGVQERTARYWMNGHSPVPRPVAMILLALSKGEISLQFVADYIEADIRKQI